MLQVEMSASLRSTSGKGAMRRLRMEGMTPAVVYGGGGDAMSLQLESKTLLAKLLEFYRRNTVVTLKIDGGGEKKVLMSEVQTHPVTDSLIHIDFCEIDLTKDRAFDVPVVFEGNAIGVDLGGALFINHATVVFEGKPLDIPDQCTLDVADLNIGESLKCSAIVVPEGARLITDLNETIVAVAMAGQKETEDEEEEESAVEVEGEETEEVEESSE
ncbi:MAG: 50S ribosomal protein L25 [Deltaproteobacteria bacterium]|nr:50S ribosomal protein L25 [Deltaproteobacteria bacterium]MBW2658136.1 50S ribosomal protein L25 [Deltaproteobacteria bacterium]